MEKLLSQRTQPRENYLFVKTDVLFLFLILKMTYQAKNRTCLGYSLINNLVSLLETRIHNDHLVINLPNQSKETNTRLGLKQFHNVAPSKIDRISFKFQDTILKDHLKKCCHCLQYMDISRPTLSNFNSHKFNRIKSLLAKHIPTFIIYLP